jgi:SAM-dependent methyltransferase
MYRRLVRAIFRCPDCAGRLELDDEGRCRECGALRVGAAGVLDFVTDPQRIQEREFYERKYAERLQGIERKWPVAGLAARWQHPAEPGHRAIWEEVGDIRGKRVLLLGNGGAVKELYLLTLAPELLIVSDLAASGVAVIRDSFDLTDHENRVCFAAIDALALPLFDESIDLVYGSALVHHLPEREPFLREVARVLRPGGRAVFFDDAYSSGWQRAKRTVLRPLLAYSHRKHPRSPEDVEATMRGGFREEVLAEEASRVGVELWSRRLLLTFYLWHRASMVLLPDRFLAYRRHPRIAGPLIRLDEWLARKPRVQPHLVRLVWGIQKPLSSTRSTTRPAARPSS